jgi:hypothetical protein
MEIYARIVQKVQVDPLDVIEKLKTDFLGDYHRWVRQENDKYFIMGEQSAGQHSYDTEIREITKEEKKYFEALDVVERYLKSIK